MAYMKTPSPVPSQLTSSAFSTAEADHLGLGRQRTRADDLLSPTPGIRLPVKIAENLHTRAHAYALAAPEAVISHATAGNLWGFPLPLRLQSSDFIHLSHAPGARACRPRGAIGHRLDFKAGDLLKGRLFTATSPDRTWTDLASSLTVDELIVAGDYMVRRRDPLSTVEALTNRVREMGARRGVIALREALRWVRPGTDSAKETELRLLLIRSGLPEPSINVAILAQTKQWVQDPDMSYQEQKIALQYDGGHHITGLQRRSDILRDDRAAELGWLVLKFSQLDLMPRGPNWQPTGVAKTRHALQSRGWHRESAA